MNRITLILLTLTIVLSTQCKKKSTTPTNSCTEITDTRDGQTYKVVKIGDQCWMAENLNYETASNSYCYNDDPVNCDEHGRLYEFEVGKTACPDGWHTPTKAEVEVLMNELGGLSVAGGKLKEGGSSGFNAKMSGNRHYSTGYGLKGQAASFLTSSSAGSNVKYGFGALKSKDDGSIGKSNKKSAYSCRCLKD
jgi:uncharacterized protein (TIGR02145 family)